jgi:hypothetical protein
MRKLSVEELVRAAVARSTGNHSPEHISDTATLQDLGYDDADAQELRLRLARATSTARSVAARFQHASPITPTSTVKAIVADLARALPRADRERARLRARPAVKAARDGRVTGDARRGTEAAVIAALSEVSPVLDFSQIAPEMKLGKDLGLDRPAIAEAMIGTLKTLRKYGVSRSFATLQIEQSSTVEAMVDLVHGALVSSHKARSAELAPLPSDVVTGRKGKRDTGMTAVRRRASGRPRGTPEAIHAPPATVDLHHDYTDDYPVPAMPDAASIDLAGETTTGRKG